VPVADSVISTDAPVPEKFASLPDTFEPSGFQTDIHPLAIVDSRAFSVMVCPEVPENVIRACWPGTPSVSVLDSPSAVGVMVPVTSEAL
jgi:hypothetical protein